MPGAARKSIRILVITGFLVSFVPVITAQQARLVSASPGEATKTAKDMFSNGDYDKAVPVLERAVADHPADTSLAGLLAMAYLYSSSRIDSAANFARVQPTMEKVIEAGGEAIFLVGRAMDKPRGKFVVKAVTGELRIGKDAVKFNPTRGSTDGLGPFSRTDLKECGLNKGYGKDSNTFHLKTAKEEFDFRPLHFSKEEASLVCTLASKYLGVKIAN